MKAALFDMDGLMLDTESVFLKAAAEIGNNIGLGDIENVSKLLIGINRAAADDILISHYGPNGSNLHEIMIARQFEMMRKDGIPKKKGIIEILTFLKDNGYKLAVASSSKFAAVRENLESTNLFNYFDFVVGGDMVEKSKPEPDIYLYALQNLNVQPENAIGFEDSYNGIRALYAGKIKSFMIPDMLPPTEEMFEKAYAVCDSLCDALEIIKNEI